MRTTRMMEAKLCAALCALLLINLGSADDDVGHAAVSNSTGSNVSSAESVHVATLSPVKHVVTSHQLNDSDTGSSFTGSLSNNATREEKNSSLSAVPEKKNGTNTTVSNPVTSQPPSPPAVNATSTTDAHPNSTATSPAQQDDTHPLNITATTTPSTNTSVTQLNQPETHSTAPATSLKPPQTETKATTAAVHSSSSPRSSTTQVSASKSASPTHAPSTSQTEARQSSTTVQTASSSTRGSGHSGSPSQLNVSGDDTTMQHDSPTLDPLLAGLVSAFIITAVIITLLLFLKLRKRGNRPEFRRLQDLPMDDMMEDTPLSMYSY